MQASNANVDTIYNFTMASSNLATYMITSSNAIIDNLNVERLATFRIITSNLTSDNGNFTDISSLNASLCNLLVSSFAGDVVRCSNMYCSNLNIGSIVNDDLVANSLHTINAVASTLSSSNVYTSNLFTNIVQSSNLESSNLNAINVTNNTIFSSNVVSKKCTVETIISSNASSSNISSTTASFYNVESSNYFGVTWGMINNKPTLSQIYNDLSKLVIPTLQADEVQLGSNLVLKSHLSNSIINANVGNLALTADGSMNVIMNNSNNNSNANVSIKFCNGSQNEYMIITGTGFVGIGKSNPSTLLDVNGTISATTVTTQSIAATSYHCSNIVTSNITANDSVINTISASNISGSNLAVSNIQSDKFLTSNIYAATSVAIGTESNVIITKSNIVINNIPVLLSSSNSIPQYALPIVSGLNTSQTYGGPSNIPQIQVDQYGRILTISSVTINTATTTPYSITGSNFVTFCNVGIGLSNPKCKLDVIGDASVSGNIMSSNIIIAASNIGIGRHPSSNALEVQGTIFATSDIIAFSDIRKKSQIQPITSALEKIKSIGGYTFLMQSNNKRSAGVIAQEIQYILPEVVYQDGDGYMSVAYGNLVALLIEGIKELTQNVEYLQRNQSVQHVQHL
jgi:hypothetical protein